MTLHLCYHDISDSGDLWSVSPTAFTWQVRWLARHLRPDAATVTFDDGYSSFADGWRWLSGTKFNVTVFVVTGMLGAVACWEGASPAPLLSAEAIRDFARQGVEFGAHSVTHPRLSQLTPAQAYREIAQSKAELEAVVGAQVRAFAYPYGEATPELAHQAQEAGFSRAFTMRSGRTRTAYMVRRVPILCCDGKLRFMLKVLTAYARWVDWHMDLRGVPG